MVVIKSFGIAAVLWLSKLKSTCLILDSLILKSQSLLVLAAASFSLYFSDLLKATLPLASIH
jgi:hypothetical protein